MPLPHAPRLPNRWRITGWIVVSVLAVTFLIGLFAVAAVKDRFTAQVDDELRARASALRSALAIIDPEELDQLARETPGGLGDDAGGVTVVDGSGKVTTLASGSPDDPDPPIAVTPRAVSALRARAGEPFDLRSADGSTTYRAVTAQLDDGGLVVATRSLEARDKAIRVVVGVMAVAGAVAAILISVIVAVVSSLVTHPLDAMIDAAEAIGDGDLTSRVPEVGVEDVTRLAGALNHMLDRLEDAFAAKEASEEAMRRFVADASHELRTPLAAVLGYAELHRSGMLADDAALDGAIDRIHGEGERMRLIVDELLTLARLDEGRPLAREDVDLAGLARLAVADAAAIEPTRPLTLDGADAAVVTTGDAMSLRQAIDNLLANARAHTPAEAPVHVAVGTRGGTAFVRVRDEGPGMEPEVAARVFDRFFRADDSRRRPGGSGLGLAIVRAIATAHGGSATVDTVPGQGATFTIELPGAGGSPRRGAASRSAASGLDLSAPR